MDKPLKLECEIYFGRKAHGQKELQDGEAPKPPRVSPGRVPRISKLMALARRLDELVRTGEVADYAELALVGEVTRARVSQISNLLLLAPDIQEALLFLPRVESGRDPIHLRDLQPIAAALDWAVQRRMWRTLLRSKGLPIGTDVL
jgi:hypothetical protein